MRVNRAMLHKDLQPYFNRVRFFSLVVKIRWLGRLADRWMRRSAIKAPCPDGLSAEEVIIPGSDGYPIRTMIYRSQSSGKQQEDPLPLLVYFHGGGYIMGCPEISADIIKDFIDTRPCVVVSPDYRKAYTQPYPAGFNDCYETLLWAVANADKIGAASDRVMIGGHSAGGGMTAAVSLKARDTGDVSLAFQMPIYPMIDDKQPADQQRYIEAPVWDSITNRIAWDAYLAELHKKDADIPTYAAPARNQRYQGLPPTITYIGSYDPFLEETRSYVDGLKQSGIDVAYEEYEQCFHGFEMMIAEADISKKAIKFIYPAYADFYDRYVAEQDKIPSPQG